MSIVPEAFQADLFRYLVLYKYGGVYNDIGHIYMRNINEMIYEDDEFVISRDFYPHKHCYIYNAFIAIYPKHPILKAIIDLVIKNVNNKYYGGNPLEPTSPGACGHAFNIFFNNPITQNINSGFYIINNFKIRMYEYPGVYIRNGTIAYIKTKFDGYYELMYTKQKKIRYSDLWNQRKIYR